MIFELHSKSNTSHLQIHLTLISSSMVKTVGLLLILMSVVIFLQVTPYFYKIPMGRKNGEDVSGLVSELKEKLSNLNQVNHYYHISHKKCIFQYYEIGVNQWIRSVRL